MTSLSLSGPISRFIILAFPFPALTLSFKFMKASISTLAAVQWQRERAIHDSRLFAIIQVWIMLSLFVLRYPTGVCGSVRVHHCCWELDYIRQNLWLSSFKYEICWCFYDYLYMDAAMTAINSIYRSICWSENCSRYCHPLYLPWSWFLNNHLGTHRIALRPEYILLATFS